MFFFRKYTAWRVVLMCVVYFIAAFFGIDMIVKDSAGVSGYVLAVIGLGFGINQIIRPFKVRKKLAKTLEKTDDESYSAKFYDDKIVINTFLISENSENKIENTIINLSTEELYSIDGKEMFLLFVNRKLIYIFPKRCLTAGQQSNLKKYFKDKAI